MGRKEWDGAHPRLAAGNPPHRPPKGIPSFGDIPWLQPSSEDAGSEPALRHRSEGHQPRCHPKGPGLALPRPSHAAGESWNAEPPPSARPPGAYSAGL